MDDTPERRSPTDAELEQEIRRGREFSPAEAMARLAGPGAMAGASPVSPVLQAETEISNWLKDNLPDSNGILPMLLARSLKGSELVLANLDSPLGALASQCRCLLDSDHRLAELVRQADAEWAQRMGERAYFDRQGFAPHPDDPYTADSVREILSALSDRLGA